MRAAILVTLAGIIVVTPALGAEHGSWPTYAHDTSREARADGAGEITHPTVAWTMQLGGIVGTAQSQVVDTDGDSRPDLIFVEAGRVAVLTTNGTVLWKSALIGATTVLGAWDLCGLGYRQVVVQTASDVRVLDGKTGATLGTFAASSAVAAQFITPMLMLTSSGGTTTAYEFAGPFPTTPSWTLASQNATDLVVGDVDGDGHDDIVRPLNNGFDIIDPQSGSVKLGPITLGDNAYYYDIVLANVDANPGDEVLLVDHSSYYSPTAGIHVVSAAGGSLHELWSHIFASSVALTTDVQTVDGCLADLDGDGLFEVTYSVWNNGQQGWNTYIDDARSGSNIAVLTNQFIEGIGDIDGDGKAELVTRTSPLANMMPVRTSLSAFDFDGRNQLPVQKPWTVANGHVFTATALANPQGGTFGKRSIDDFSLTTPGSELLIGRDASNRGEDTELDVIEGTTGTTLSTAPVDMHVDLQLGWFGDAASSPTSLADVVTFEATGDVRIRTNALVEVAAATAGTFANWISVTPYTNGNNIVLFSDGTRAVRWLDGTTLTANGTPNQVFSVPGTVSSVTSAAYGYGLDPVFYIPGPSPLLVTQDQDDTVVTLVAHDVSGVEVWRTNLAPGTWVHPPGAYVTDLNGDGTADLLFNLVNINGLASFAIFDGVNGSLLRSTPLATIAANADEFLHGAIVDIDNDSQPDLVGPVSSLGIMAIDLFSAPMMAKWVLPSTPTLMVNGTVAAASYDESQDLALYRVGGNNGFGPYAHIDLEGNIVAQYDTSIQTPNGDSNYSAFVKRGGTSKALDIISVGSSDVALSRIVRIDGNDMTIDWQVYASGGSVTQARPSAVYRLHDPLSMDVDGDGTEEVVFGSDDGYVYAVHASDGTLAFSLFLDAPVAHVIGANIDLDSPLELVASLSDGRLVAIDENGKYVAHPQAAVDGGVEAGAGVDGGVTSKCPPTSAPSCACTYGGRSPKVPMSLALLAALFVLVRRHRRRHALN